MARDRESKLLSLMVIGNIAGQSTESEERRIGKVNLDFEALCPLVIPLRLQLELNEG
jgi:hypothetical protein